MSAQHSEAFSFGARGSAGRSGGLLLATSSATLRPRVDIAAQLERPPRLSTSCQWQPHDSGARRPASQGVGRAHRQKRNGSVVAAVGGLIGGAASWLLAPSKADASQLPLPIGEAQTPPKSAKDNGKTRVLILMSDTGGGHRASAEAIKGTFEQLYPGKFEVTIVDALKRMRWPVSCFGDSYNFMVKYKFLWRIGFRVAEPLPVRGPVQAFWGVYTQSEVVRMYRELKPQLVVSVHPLCQDIPLMALKDAIKRAHLPKHTPFVTVVTDFAAAHPTWFHKGVSKCFVATDKLVREAKKHGLSDSQIVCHGLPIRPSFASRHPSKDKLRKNLGLKSGVKTVLLAGGGEGMGSLEKTSRAIADMLGSDIQVVVICGRNQKLANKLKALDWNGAHMAIKGFVTNMSEWMAASDCLITKAGPGTIAEALISGLPLILNGFIPCQEYGNVDYVVSNKCGVFEKEPQKIAQVLSDWLGPKKDELTQMAERCKALGRPQATFRIVSDLAEIIKQGSNARLAMQ